MWISKDRYKKLLATDENIERAYESLIAAYKKQDRLAEERDQYKAECSELKAELSKYKQMYADEVQKRLLLVERIDSPCE